MSQGKWPTRGTPPPLNGFNMKWSFMRNWFVYKFSSLQGWCTCACGLTWVQSVPGQVSNTERVATMGSKSTHRGYNWGDCACNEMLSPSISPSPPCDFGRQRPKLPAGVNQFICVLLPIGHCLPDLKQLHQFQEVNPEFFKKPQALMCIKGGWRRNLLRPVDFFGWRQKSTILMTTPGFGERERDYGGRIVMIMRLLARKCQSNLSDAFQFMTKTRGLFTLEMFMILSSSPFSRRRYVPSNTHDQGQARHFWREKRTYQRAES